MDWRQLSNNYTNRYSYAYRYTNTYFNIYMINIYFRLSSVSVTVTTPCALPFPRTSTSLALTRAQKIESNLLLTRLEKQKFCHAMPPAQVPTQLMASLSDHWAVWPEKIAKCLKKVAKNDFNRNMIDFDNFTKNPWECGRFEQINYCQRL